MRQHFYFSLACLQYSCSELPAVVAAEYNFDGAESGALTPCAVYMQKHMDYATCTMNQWAEIIHFMHIRLSTASFLKSLDKMGALCHLSGTKNTIN